MKTKIYVSELKLERPSAVRVRAHFYAIYHDSEYNNIVISYNSRRLYYHIYIIILLEQNVHLYTVGRR